MIKFKARWVDETFKVSPHVAGKLVKMLERGEIVQLDLVDARTLLDHNHYFACIKAAHDSLPEDIGVDFKTPEHLRKWALIKAGYCTTVNTVCKSHAEAQRLALFARMLDEYAISTVERRIVTTYRAVSQSYEAMSRKTFHASKDAVLDVLSKLLGANVDELLRSVPRGEAIDRRSNTRDGLDDRADEEVVRPPHQRSPA